MAAVIICSDFGAPQNKVFHCFHCFPIYLPWSDGPKCHDLSFLNVKPTFPLSSFTFIKRLFSFSLSAIGWCHLHVWGYWYFSRHLDSSLCFIQPSVLRESFPRQVDRKSWGPQGERGLEFSRRKKGQTFHSLCRLGPGDWSRWKWQGNRQEGQGSPNGGNSPQVSDVFISLKRQEETN